MTPSEPGLYWGQELIFGLGGWRLTTPTALYEVVSDVPNPRKDKLLVKTGVKHPKYRSLDCYEWLRRYEQFAREEK